MKYYLVKSFILYHSLSKECLQQHIVLLPDKPSSFNLPSFLSMYRCLFINPRFHYNTRTPPPALLSYPYVVT